MMSDFHYPMDGFLASAFLLCGQFFKSKDRCSDHMEQGIQKQIGILATVKPETHFVQVELKMFCTHMMPSPHNAALEKRERGLDGIGVNVPVHVTTFAVNDGLVILDSSLPHGYGVGVEIIGEHHFHIFADILADILGEGARPRILGVKEAEIAIALADADYDFFVVHTGTDAFSTIHPAHIGSIHFNFPVKHGLIGQSHGMANTVTEIPCCFVPADSESPLNLTSTHTLFGFAEQKRCSKPLHQRQVRIVKNSSGCNGKLIVAIFAIEELLVGSEFNCVGFTAGATWSLGPAQTDKQFTTLFFGGEQSVYVN